jgi:hypothetical protein
LPIHKADRIVHDLCAQSHIVPLHYVSTVIRLDRLKHHHQPLDLNIIIASLDSNPTAPVNQKGGKITALAS